MLTPYSSTPVNPSSSKAGCPLTCGCWLAGHFKLRVRLKSKFWGSRGEGAPWEKQGVHPGLVGNQTTFGGDTTRFFELGLINMGSTLYGSIFYQSLPCRFVHKDKGKLQHMGGMLPKDRRPRLLLGLPFFPKLASRKDTHRVKS